MHSIRRRLRHQSAPSSAAFVPKTRANDETDNPLRRRDPSQVSAHRVYDPSSGLACFLVGKCVPCSEMEKTEEEKMCRETGYRQELECPRAWTASTPSLVADPEGGGQKRFQSCFPNTTLFHGVAVLKFEAVMIVLLIVSVVLLRRERRKHLSAFNLLQDAE
ncbi:unnamed protein product [Hyaloperonospora brassicae]|uniref:Uncharacterized protein n=1 Tax=Hyaloperonospora brassicae TaxID=162125 RepID=A0AAV0TDJ6_HYABA|nr:unnamed protein product [Hyaloperonospora brassicae]